MSRFARLTELGLEVTNACRHRCLHCSTNGGPAELNELSQSERVRVVREAADLGAQELRLLGGDPLLRLGETAGLLDEAAELGFQRAVVYTSAAEPVVTWLSAVAHHGPPATTFEASIYSTSAQIHDSITCAPGSLDRLLASTRESRRLGMSLNWLFVWMKPNFTELAPVVELASEMGVRIIRILRLMPNGRARLNRSLLEPTGDLMSSRAATLADLSHRFPNVHLAYSKPLQFQIHSGQAASTCCGAGIRQLVVQADGAVLPCIGMKDKKDRPSLSIGNVRTHSLAQILRRSQSLGLGGLSKQLHECPAAVYQDSPNLIQIAS